jgi:hypothetical protein
MLMGNYTLEMQILVTKNQLAKELNKDVRGLKDLKPVYVLKTGEKLLPLFNLFVKK